MKQVVPFKKGVRKGYAECNIYISCI